MNDSHYIAHSKKILYTFGNNKSVDHITKNSFSIPQSNILHNFITMGPTQSRYVVDRHAPTQPSFDYEDIIFNERLNIFCLSYHSYLQTDAESTQPERQGISVTENNINYKPGQKALYP